MDRIRCARCSQPLTAEESKKGNVCVACLQYLLDFGHRDLRDAQTKSERLESENAALRARVDGLGGALNTISTWDTQLCKTTMDCITLLKEYARASLEPDNETR